MLVQRQLTGQQGHLDLARHRPQQALAAFAKGALGLWMLSKSMIGGHALLARVGLFAAGLAPRTARGMTGWINHLPVSGDQRRRADRGPAPSRGGSRRG